MRNRCQHDVDQRDDQQREAHAGDHEPGRDGPGVRAVAHVVGAQHDPERPDGHERAAGREDQPPVALRERHRHRREHEAPAAEGQGGQPRAERREAHPDLDPHGEHQEEPLEPGRERELHEQPGRERGDAHQGRAQERRHAYVLAALLDDTQDDEPRNPRGEHEPDPGWPAEATTLEQRVGDRDDRRRE